METQSKSALDVMKEVYQRQNFVVLDTETTGLHEGEVCQIAIIDHRAITLLDTLVKPVNGIPPDATRIHGITNFDVEESPRWSEIAPIVAACIAGRDVIVYNAVYDRKMMHKSAEACGIEKIDWKTISPFHCAKEAFAEYYGDWNDYHGSFRWQTLSTAVRHFGLRIEDAHSALSDCLMTLDVVRCMARGRDG
jgi:DNA polymerase-3 subunit epsilon